MDSQVPIPYVRVAFTCAGVAELVDAPDSKSGFFGSVGSSPTTRTIDPIRGTWGRPTQIG